MCTFPINWNGRQSSSKTIFMLLFSSIRKTHTHQCVNRKWIINQLLFVRCNTYMELERLSIFLLGHCVFPVVFPLYLAILSLCVRLRACLRVFLLCVTKTKRNSAVGAKWWNYHLYYMQFSHRFGIRSIGMPFLCGHFMSVRVCVCERANLVLLNQANIRAKRVRKQMGKWAKERERKRKWIAIDAINFAWNWPPVVVMYVLK